MKKTFFNIIILVILFLGNILIYNYKYYFSIIYASLISYQIFILYLLVKNCIFLKEEIKYFCYTSLLLYLITYYIICDPNPFTVVFFYYTFYPNFLKAILIVIIHTFFIYCFIKEKKNIFINLKSKENSTFYSILVKIQLYLNDNFDSSYFFFCFSDERQNKKLFCFFLLGLISLYILDAFLFVNRITLWVHFYKKDKTLPIFTSRNTTFFIASNVFNIEKIAETYFEEMKKLISYLGESNVIVSIVENGDSTDKTRYYLKNFEKYLNKKHIMNKFILAQEIIDPRRMKQPFLKISRLRIEYYSKLRNKCLEFLYQIRNIDFENTIIIFFNDIIFKYEDIINLLSTNNEEFDSVCGLDIINHYLYDTWVSVDLDGNSLKHYFPYIHNKEGQDLVINHRPVRVFSCWNGVMVFKASPLKDKKIKFRNKINNAIKKDKLNNHISLYYESECTYFHIDLFSLGYTKKFLNPDVRVVYKNNDIFGAKYFFLYINDIINYFTMYIMNIMKKRNKFMSNNYDKDIKLSKVLNNWYLQNKL